MCVEKKRMRVNERETGIEKETERETEKEIERESKRRRSVSVGPHISLPHLLRHQDTP